MKFFFSIMLLCVTLFSAGQIEWNKDKTLKSTDFKGEPKPTTMVASTCSMLRVDPIVRYGKRYFLVRAMFIPDNSYIRPKVATNDTVLRHEQLHFDITELYARRLRKSINEYQGLTTREEYDAVNAEFNKCVNAWNTAQNLYDAQTAHCTNYLQQKMWESDVQAALNAMQDWELNPKSAIYNIEERAK